MLEVQVEPNLVCYNALFDSPAICGSDIGSHMFKLCTLQFISARRECEASKIDLHGLSEGMAQLTLSNWLETAVARELEGTSSLSCTIITRYYHNMENLARCGVAETSVKLPWICL